MSHVIRGGRETLRGAVACIVEVQVAELYQGTSHFDDIYMELNVLGFVFCGTFDQFLGREAKVLFFDGLFIKPGVLCCLSPTVILYGFYLRLLPFSSSSPSSSTSAFFFSSSFFSFLSSFLLFFSFFFF